MSSNSSFARLVPGTGNSFPAINLPLDSPLVVGRRGTDCLVIDDPQLSRRHAVLWNQDGTWWIRDEGSLNGTFVNGEAIRETSLQAGALVNFGGTIEFRLEMDSAPVGGKESSDLQSRLFCLGLEPVAGGRSVFLRRELTIVGRNATADIVLDEPRVSGIHARIERSHGRTSLLDSGSRNGTVVNGETVRRAELKPGDEVIFGDHAFRVKRTFYPTGLLMTGLVSTAFVLVLALLLPALFRSGTSNVERLWTREMYLAQVNESLVEAVRACDSEPRNTEVARAQFAVAQRSLVAADILPLDEPTEADLQAAFRKVSVDHRVTRELNGRDVFAIYKSLDAPEVVSPAEQAEPEPVEPEQKETEPPVVAYELDEELSRLVAQFGIDTRRRPIPDQMRVEVARCIEMWTGSKRGFTKRTFKRSQPYLEMIKTQMREHRLPEVFAYLPFIESGYQASVTSTAKARGLWQFMPSTGRAYGLQVDELVDERTDPEKATKAACMYIESLLNMFGPNAFLCAVAAYNKGENGMARCLKKYGDWRSTWKFWDVVENNNGCLKPETVEYVPRFLAAAIIMRRPEVFGLTMD
jgi:pSer/pThr/pTyr-binding forkhead associated (FHA) protein